MLDRFTFHIQLSESRAESLSKIMRSLFLMGPEIKFIKKTRNLFLIGNCGGYQFPKHMLIHLTRNDKAKTFTHEIALLNRVSINPLLSLDSRIAIIFDGKKQTSMSYVSDWISSTLPNHVTIKATHPIAAIPFVMQSTRIGISIGIVSCQTLVALSNLSRNNVENPDLMNITTEDLLTALAGVLYNVAKLAVTKPSERYLTSTFWNRFFEEHTSDEIVCMIHDIVRLQVKDIKELITVLKQDYTPVFDIAFGRVKDTINNNFIPETDAECAIVTLTEQMGLFDLGRFLDNGSKIEEVKILYTPLTLNTMLLMKEICKIIKPRKKVTFHYHIGFLAISAETLLRFHIEECKGKAIILIPGGGQLNFLIALKIKKDYDNVELG